MSRMEKILEDLGQIQSALRGLIPDVVIHDDVEVADPILKPLYTSIGGRTYQVQAIPQGGQSSYGWHANYVQAFAKADLKAADLVTKDELIARGIKFFDASHTVKAEAINALTGTVGPANA